METYHPPKEVEAKENNSDLPEKKLFQKNGYLKKLIV